MIYCKTLELKDYVRFEWVTSLIHDVKEKLNEAGAANRFEHKHRAWEYGLITQALGVHKCKLVVDVGGGASVFAPSYQTLYKDAKVVQVDPGPELEWIPAQEKVLDMKLHSIRCCFENFVHEEQYDAVVSVSTIEHVEDDFKFYAGLLRHVKPGGLCAITFDYHPEGKALVDGHLRTYDYERIQDLIGIAEDQAFHVHGTGMDYRWRGPAVGEYTFASLVMEKAE